MAPTTFKTAGGKELILSPFVLATTRIALPKIREMEAGADLLVQSEAMVEILAEALRRDNPDVNKAWLDEHITTEELGDLYTATIAASGLVKRAATGEAKSP